MSSIWASTICSIPLSINACSSRSLRLSLICSKRSALRSLEFNESLDVSGAMSSNSSSDGSLNVSPISGMSESSPRLMTPRLAMSWASISIHSHRCILSSNSSSDSPSFLTGLSQNCCLLAALPVLGPS